MKLRKSILALAVLAIVSGAAHAAAVKYVDSAGKPMFAINFTNDSAQKDAAGNQWSLTEDQRGAITDAASIWGEIFAPGSANTTYLPLSVTLVYKPGDDDNASAWSDVMEEADPKYGNFTQFQNGIITGKIVAPNLAEYKINQSTTITYMPYLYPVPNTDATQELTTTTFHELSHALGILSDATSLYTIKTKWEDLKDEPDFDKMKEYLIETGLMDEDENFLVSDAQLRKIAFSIAQSSFARNLYSFWQNDGAGYVIDLTKTPKRLEEGSVLSFSDVALANSFVVGPNQNSGVYFIGDNVKEVLNGALPGVPVNGTEKLDIFELSHLELAHSLLSHQNYRNYVTLMEAEMAVFQDIGYKIDRRNFYGYSEYRNNQTYVNTHPYYARNAEGTAYIEGKPNTATLGVGFHIYGDSNTITQGADLLADGRGGTGIRADGSNNKIIIPATTRITANGDHGTGILMSYGKNNSIISAGTVEATGTGGKAVAFDFGLNMLGESVESRGSYIRTVGEDNRAISGPTSAVNAFLLNLDGPLVSTFDLSGTLSGSYAAIYISDNALVQNINVLNGASINGNIISLWDPNNSKIQKGSLPEDTFYTNLTFGYAKNADGSANTGAVDSSFSLDYKGDIKGANSIKMKVAGGLLTLGGQVEVYSLVNDANLALNSNLNGKEVITSNYVSEGGNIITTFNRKGTLSGFITAQTATISNATWTLGSNDAAFYANGSSLVLSDAPVMDANEKGYEGYTAYKALSSTLTLDVTDIASGDPVVHFSRASDAYSALAGSQEQYELGRALDRIVLNPSADMQSLIGTIDWIAEPSGVRAAYEELSPTAYSYFDMAAMHEMVRIDNQLIRHMQSGLLEKGMRSQVKNLKNEYALTSDDYAYDKWHGFLITYGDRSIFHGRNGNRNMKSTSGGVIGGVEYVSADGLTYGIDGGVIARHTSVASGRTDRMNSVGGFVGGHVLYAPQTWNGFYAMGTVRLGFEENKGKRHVNISNYGQTAKSSFVSTNAGIMAGGGYDLKFGNTTLGPVLYTEYNLMHHDNFNEKNAQGANLKVKNRNSDSWQSSLGMRLNHVLNIQQDLNMVLSAEIDWKHEFLDPHYKTKAAFSEYGQYGFSSRVDKANRDALCGEVSLRFVKPSWNFNLDMISGYEYSKSSRIFNFGLFARVLF
ncbi:MAG: autotransporter domain-containing protein [Succinivibrio sp.]|nr:autotransporter domain-containing protein [Succinivibrio sp.]